MIEKIRASKAVQIIKSVIENKYFVFLSAFVTVLFYYLGLELVTIYFLVLSGTLMLLLLDDLTPMTGIVLFAMILMSPMHTPSTAGASDDFLFQTSFLVQIIIIVALFGGAAIFRFVNTIVKKKFTITPTFISLAIFCFVLLFNGATSSGYTARNILYALTLTACFVGIFALFKDNISWSKETMEKLAFIFLAFSAALLLEMLITYLTSENVLLQSGAIDRKIFRLGWGSYNNLASYMLFCLPFPLYLAATKKFGFLYLIYSILFAIGIIFSLSRQGMVTVVLIYPACLVTTLIKGKNRFTNLIAVGAAAVLSAILLGIFHEKIFTLLSSSSDSNKAAMILVALAAVAFAGVCALFLLCKNKKIDLAVVGGLIIIALLVALVKRDEIYRLVGEFMRSSSGRNKLWQEAYSSFEKFPAFGVGFYRELAADPGSSGLAFIPDMYHNTVFQLLGACGIFGFFAYFAHRAVTVYCGVKAPSFARLTIAASIGGLLISCMFDNHIFYLTGTTIYSVLLAFFDKSYYAETGALPLNKSFNRA